MRTGVVEGFNSLCSFEMVGLEGHQLGSFARILAWILPSLGLSLSIKGFRVR